MPGEQIPLAFDATAALQLLDQLESRVQRLASLTGDLPIGSSNSGSGGRTGGGGTNGSGDGGGGGGSSSGSSSGGIFNLTNALAVAAGPLAPAVLAAGAASQSLGQGVMAQSNLNVGNGALGAYTAESAALGADSFIDKGIDLIDSVGGPLVQGLTAGFRKKKDAIKEQMFQPLGNASARLEGVASALGRAGVRISDADLNIGSEILIQQERQAYEAKKRAHQAVYGNGHVMDSFTFSIAHSF